jgi:hypothetical protein
VGNSFTEIPPVTFQRGRSLLKYDTGNSRKSKEYLEVQLHSTRSALARTINNGWKPV